VTDLKGNEGLHIISDFYFCENKKVLLNHEIFTEKLLTYIKDNGMNPFGHLLKYFGEDKNSGYTLIIGLEESHISLHTFPLEHEEEKCSLDVYTCSISKDNGLACKKVYQFLLEVFQPKEVRNEHLIERI